MQTRAACRACGLAYSRLRAVVREWVVVTLLIQVAGVALTGPIVPLLDYISPWWDERNRALHDRVASTTVQETGGRTRQS
jgi:hypothetical protein